MRITYHGNTELSVTVKDFLIKGEYGQNDTALISYDDLYDYLESISIPKFSTEINTNPLQ